MTGENRPSAAWWAEGTTSRSPASWISCAGCWFAGSTRPPCVPEAASEDEILARDGRNFVEWYRHILQERQDLNLEYTQALTFLTIGRGQAVFIDEPVNYVGLPEIQPWLTSLADACGSGDGLSQVGESQRLSKTGKGIGGNVSA